MKNILLVTQGFPYGNKECGFLPSEYEKLSQQSRLTVLPLEKALHSGILWRRAWIIGAMTGMNR